MLQGEDETEEFHSRAMRIAVGTVRERAEQKLTPSYLRESLGDGYKYAYDWELTFESQERGEVLLRRVLANAGPPSSPDEQELLRTVDPREAMDFYFWGSLRRRWSAAKRKKEEMRFSDWAAEAIRIGMDG